ncbi:MAG: PKD domain-containing protein, partial [Lachnospiraceae bacterium]|nr:PKD domain-containing protein [Lachnospiraceae bacterium]
TGTQQMRIRYCVTDADGNSDSRQVRYEINRTPPKAPTHIKATSRQGNVELSWEPSVSADCTSYLIFRRDMESNTCEKIAQVSGIYTEAYVDKKAVEGKEYEYWLVAVDKYEQKSAVSSSAFVVVEPDKEVPKIVKIGLNERITQKVTISVEASDNKLVKSVMLYYRMAGQDTWYSLGEKQVERNLQDKGTAQFDWYTNRVSDGRYEIKAVAKDAAGNLSVAVTKECEVDNTGISKVEILEGSATSTELQLAWSQAAEKDISYFAVERKNNNNVSILKTYIKATGCKISDLSPGTEYVLRVVGYDLLGNRGEPSDWYTISTTEDTIAPIIKRIGPNISVYNSNLYLEAEIEDNSAVGQAVFSYSYDKINYEEIATVNGYGNSKKEVLSYSWDISNMKEGTVYVKFEAYDKAGNKNGNTEEVIAEYVIDRTPPKVVDNVQISGESGAIKLQWKQEEDVWGYEIYRAGEGTNFYMLLHTTTSDYFVDKSCSYKKTYMYQIVAIDRAGNRSELSEPVIWTAEKDTEAPVIHACTIKENEVISGNPTIKVMASDNVSLKEINLKYRKTGEFAWEKIGDYDVSGDLYRLETVWDTTGLESGQYEFQAMAVDINGNGSISYQKQFTLDMNAPKAPDISVTEKDGKVLLAISENEEPDFSHYNIYKMSRGEERFRLLKKVTANQFEDGEILPETRYYYYVEACDKAGNAARSSEVYILTSDTDIVPPNAKLSDVMGIEGREIAFSGEKSTDNIKIESYKWDMGDGTILYGKNPKHTYQTAGEYSVTLTVTDGKGNQASTVATASVKDKTKCGIHTIHVKNSMDQLMAGAAVYVCFADGTVKEMETDGEGKVIISGTAGEHAAAVFVSGYLIAEKNFKISVYEDLSTTIILQEGSMVGGEITAEKLSIEDIKKYSIDVTDEENFFEYSYKVQTSFESNAVPGFEFQFRGSTKKTSIGNGIGFVTGSGGNSGGGNKDDSEISTSAKVVYAGEKPVVAYCTTAPASVKWLKDMYIVTVTIQNYADEKYVIEDSNVILNLPKGISLAKLMEAQNLSQAMGIIEGQSSATASWIVKADETGEYQVSADFKGRLQPFEKEITAKIENTIKFGADSGDGLHLYIYPETTAYIGEKYYFQYQLKNESKEPVYYVTAKFGAYRTTDFVQVVDTYVNGELTQSVRNSTGIKYYTASTEGAHIPILCEGDSVTVESLGAGQSIYGTYCEYFPGGGDPARVYYKLSNAVVKKLSDSNADMKVTVMPIQGHMTKANISITLPVEDDTDEETGEESGGNTSGGNKKNPDNKKHTPSTGKPTTPTGTSTERDPINVMTGAFESKQCVMAASGVNDIRFQLAYNSLETNMEGDLGYGWHHNYESKIEDQNGLLKVWLTPYDSLLFVNEDLMNNKVEGTYRDGEIWLGDMEPENIDGKGGITRSTISGNSVSGNAISENSMPEDLLPRNAVSPEEPGNKEQTGDKADIPADKVDKPCSYVPISENMKGYSVEKTDGVYIFRTPDMTEYHYDEKGQLIKRVNEKGQVLNISHPEGQLVISEPYTEKSITAVMNQDGNIVSLRDNGGNQVTFAYDANNNLSSVTSKGGTSNYYSYDEGHRIVEGRDTDHTLFVQNTYDEKGRVLTQDDGEAATKPVTLHYEDNEENGNTVITMNDMNGAVKTITADSLGKGLRYQDGIGGIFTYAYNEKGDMVSYRNADGTGEDYAYDENGNITKLVETSGRTTTYTYNECNQLLSQTCNDGTSLTYAYGGNNQTASITSGNGAVVRYEYNEQGQVTKEVVEGLGETSYQYSGGMLTQIIDSNGNVSKYLYDSIGNVVQYINGKGTVTDYEIAPNGKVLKETVTLADGSKAVTSYAYDAYGNQTKKTDANGNSTTYQYDKNDRLIKEIRADGSTITYDRDVDGNITKITYPDGMTTIEAAYDTAGNLLTLKDALKSTMVQSFNSGSQLTGTAFANGGTITYRYYDNGLLKSETDAMGNTITYTYDSAGRVTGITDKMGNTTSYGYDEAGNAATVTNPEGETVTVAYNQYRQAVSTTDARGNTTRYEYDRMGNCVRMTDALNHVTEYEYNGNNEIVKVIRKGENGHDDIILTYAYDHLGNVTLITDGEGNSYRMDYDKVGNLKAIYDAYGTAVESYSYDKVYNQTAIKDAKGNETAMTYDSLGNMVSMLNKATGSATTYTYVGGQLLSSSTDALGGRVTAEYDAMGNVESFTNPNGGVTKYTYDLNNRITGESIGSEYKHAYEYNANGQVVKKTNSNGQVTEYTYDRAGRVTSLKDQLGTISYTYDKNGNLLTVTDSNGTITREYDALNRVTSYKDTRGNTIRYGYDEFGNLTAITYPNGKQVIYTYDKNGNIKTATDWEGRTTTYEYDKNSRLVKTTRPNDTVETRTYDEAGQLLTILDKKGNQTINSQEYSYDVSGNITAVKSGQVGELQNSSDISDTSMEYDKTNRLIKYNGKEVKYDKEGNMVYGPLNGAMTNFTYDCRNRLVQAGNTKYEYDAEDNRTAVIKNAGTKEEIRTEYVVDSVEELSRVLMAVEKKMGNAVTGSGIEGTTGNEALQATYFYYGNGLTAQENEKEGYLTYHFNNVGSTNAVTDEKGAVKYSYTYNPYGELTKGSYGQVMFLFNGQYGVASDDNGLYYMRARYYNVSIKRFINQDVVTGNIAESQSLNRYSYVEGNPVSYLDPFGLMRESIDEIHDLISEINEYISISVGLLIVTALILPETAEISLALIDVLGKVSMALNIADALLYATEMCMAGDYNEQWYEAFWGAVSSLGSVIINQRDPIGNSKAVKYDHEVHSKALVESAKWFLNYIYDGIRGMVDAICF